ncbi:MAG: hypothetical protein LW698_13990 [Planctomycetaceae bacterium]|jgi:hypothetical protein|nr:hypothetical protein [Planctomycetaceae bacterium]
MLHSAAGNIAFAHYPKTAGCTMFQWFTTAFPDAMHLDPERPHMNVRRSLRHMGAVKTPGPSGGLRLLNPADWLAARRPRPAADHSGLRIVGVIREPFEMLVSLYEFWKKTPAEMEVSPFIETARSGTFPDFLWMAVVQKEMPKYEEFFDVGGSAWANTRLIDFATLESGLAAVCAELGIHDPPRLERINAGGGRQRSLEDYRASVGTLVINVRSHFRWYYEHGVRLAIRGGDRRIAA